MLQSITLKFTDSPELLLPAEGITVFVGPNNSGKSLILREIEQAAMVHPFPQNLQILQDYEVNWPSREEIESFVRNFEGPPIQNIPTGHMSMGRINPNGGAENTQVNIEHVMRVWKNKSDKAFFVTQFARFGFIRLDGRSRFNLTNDQNAGDLIEAPRNILAKLFRDDRSREIARGYIRDAFGLSLVIDPTNLGQLRIRLSNDDILSDEQSLNNDARNFHSRALHIKDASDGVQAYVGIIASVVSGEYHTTLIDEPEAFLHPPLARKLGRHLTQLAGSRNGSLFASTHSADFLMGCIQGSSSVRVVRLEYQGGKSKGRLIDSSKLRTLFQNPLMRSTNAASGLFYDGVIVTESDNDRAFYSEVYHRLLEIDSSLPSILFVNAQNKQTIKDIMGPLRALGVPTAATPDIDILKDGGTTWTNWLTAAQIPVGLHASFHSQRQVIKHAFEGAGVNMKTEGGIDALNGSDRAAADHLFDSLDSYGIFAVRSGEIESWLKSRGISGHGTPWAIAMLQSLGDDPSDASYVRPEAGDVWDFVRKVVEWIGSPARKGVS